MKLKLHTGFKLHSPFKKFSMGYGANKQRCNGKMTIPGLGSGYVGYGGHKHHFVASDSSEGVLRSVHSAYGYSSVRGNYPNPLRSKI